MDSEWHTVPCKGNGSSKQTTKQSKNGGDNHNKNKRLSISKTAATTTKANNNKSGQQQRRQSLPARQHRKEERSNHNHQRQQNSSGSESEDDDDEESVIDKVPPYHTAIFSVCPLDNCPATEPFLDTTSLVNHLRTEHRVVFRNLHHMYMALDAYLSRWAAEFKKKPVEEHGFPNDGNVYVIDPSQCGLDKEIREEMQRAKLNEVLAIQQRERATDAKVPRKCLFCKIVCEDRAVLFKHMFAEHNFNIGLPDNLVNVNEFLELLENKLSKLQCLYCEKTFTSAPVLRKHMRKKKHFKIASKNRQYDRFYVINYLEPGKNWEYFERDNYESDDEKRDESWADWQEEEDEPTMCLFDNDVMRTAKEALTHMKDVHSFDLSSIRKEQDLDFYKTITLINYIRHQSSLNRCFACGTTVEDFALLAKHMHENDCFKKPLDMDAAFWKDPKYLMPTYENDPLLTGFEEEDDEEDTQLSDTEANSRYLSQVMTESLALSDAALTAAAGHHPLAQEIPNAS